MTLRKHQVMVTRFSGTEQCVIIIGCHLFSKTYKCNLCHLLQSSPTIYTMPEGKKVSYGTFHFDHLIGHTDNKPSVRLGNSGLKVSKIILGCLSYGTPEWNGWILPEEESIKHIKAA